MVFPSRGIAILDSEPFTGQACIEMFRKHGLIEQGTPVLEITSGIFGLALAASVRKWLFRCALPDGPFSFRLMTGAPTSRSSQGAHAGNGVKFPKVPPGAARSGWHGHCQCQTVKPGGRAGQTRPDRRSRFGSSFSEGAA
jgi:hypothetical protein